jgi:MFS family permease
VRPEVAAADRALAVRQAARAWRRRDWIDAAALARIEADYADDRVRVGPSFRLLFFVLTIFVGCAATGLLALLVRGDAAIGGLLAAAGIAFAFATEQLTGPGRRAQSGVESAASLLAVGSSALGLVLIAAEGIGWSSTPLGLLLALCGVVCGLAAWRWGYWIYAGAAAALAAFAAATTSFGRLLWIAVPLGACRALAAATESGRLAPAHRRCASAVLAVLLAALYAAVNVWGLDHDFFREWSSSRSSPGIGHIPLVRPIAILLTILVPAALLVAGIRRRHRLIWSAGALAALASLITLRQYVHVAPAWVVLTSSGAAAMAVAVALRRWLDGGPERERGGFTAEPLLEETRRHRLVELAATVAASTRHAAPAAPTPESEPFRGGGGQFGGGGASGSF